MRKREKGERGREGEKEKARGRARGGIGREG